MSASTAAVSRSSAAALPAVIALVLPMAGLALLIAEPSLDVRWEHHPSHFWLVVAAGVLSGILAYATGSAAARRGDARVFLISQALMVAAGFLALHALATPQVLLETPNAGFALATPVGLLIAALFAAAAASPRLEGAAAARVTRNARTFRLGIGALLLLWGAVSLASLPPLDDPSAPERASGPFLAFAVAGVVIYGVAVLGFFDLYRRRRSMLVLGVVAALVLLAEAMIAVCFGRNWHATWWEWHVLMLLAFGVVAFTAQRQWHEERFSELYLDETKAGRREISVLFADLAGFTSFSEDNDPNEVAEMLNAYFEVAIPPAVKRHGGDVDRIVGDALMVTWNRRGDQPDHADRAVRAALAIQRATASVADDHPGWPRFRVGVNSGSAMVGVLGAAGGRTHTAIGDTVNVAARIEGAAPVGGVAVGPETASRLTEAELVPCGSIELKGKAEPMQVYRVVVSSEGPATP